MHTSPPRKFSECAARFLIRLGFIATGIYVISMEDAKLQNLIVEPVFFFCTLQSITLASKYPKFRFIRI